MFNRETPREIVALDEAIDELYSEMKGFGSDTEEYDRITTQLVKLMKLKEEISSKSRVSPDTLAMVGSNLAGILLILNFERAGVVASKALGFVTKLR